MCQLQLVSPDVCKGWSSLGRTPAQCREDMCQTNMASEQQALHCSNGSCKQSWHVTSIALIIPVIRAAPDRFGVAKASQAALTMKGGSSKSGTTELGVEYGKLYCACMK